MSSAERAGEWKNGMVTKIEKSKNNKLRGGGMPFFAGKTSKKRGFSRVGGRKPGEKAIFSPGNFAVISNVRTFETQYDMEGSKFGKNLRAEAHGT